MRYKIGNQSFCWIYLFLSCICVFFTYVTSFDNQFFPLALVCVIELVLFLVFHKKTSGSYFSFGSIFVLVLTVFHFGQVFICGFWRDLIKTLKLRIVLNYFSDTECAYSMRIINISFILICFGILKVLGTGGIENGKHEVEDDIDSILLLTEKKAWMIIILTFPIKAIIDSIFFYKSFTSSFTSATIWLAGFPDFIKTIGNLSMVGFALLILSLKNRKWKQIQAFLFIMAYLGATVISGRRSDTISYILILVFVFFRSSKDLKISPKQIITYGALGYLLLTLMYTTVSMRDWSDKSVDAFFDLFWRFLIKQNIFMEAIREYGNTGYTPVCVISNYLENYSPSLGKSYTYGFSAIFPNIGGIVGPMIESSNYAIQLQKSHMVLDGFKNIGGSVIGEFFFNFGVIGGLVVSPLFGIFIGKVSEKTNSYLKENNMHMLMYYIPIMFATLYWIRDVFGSGIREVIWGIVFCAFVNKLSFKSN